MEETRACNSCGRVFPLTHEYFNYRDKAKGLLQGMCRECRHAYINSRLENSEIREREREGKRRYYWTHKEQEKERSRIKNGRRYWGDEEFAKRTGWNPEDAPSEYTYEGSPETFRQKSREFYHANPEKAREMKERWVSNNKDHVREYTRRTQRERYYSDPIFRRRVRDRNNINAAFNCTESQSWPQASDLIGMPCKEFRSYMLKTFEETYGYPWDGVEPVEIDHIVPLVTATTPDEVDALCHYTNLRLLKAKDNVAKGTSLDYQIGGAVC